jgi:hypothetical protein
MPVGAHPPSPWRSGARSRSSRCRGRWTMTCRSRPGAWPSWPTSWSPRGWSTITCHEGLRVLLHEEGVSFQRLTTWKQSHDPDFEAKKNRILHLYGSWMAPTTSSPATRRGPLRRRVRAAQPPAPSRPPLAVQGGGGARPRRRRRATYTRPRHLLAAYDLSRDRLYGHIKPRKRRGEFLVFLRYLRTLYPRLSRSP